MLALFVNDTAEFSSSIADVCVNFSKQDIIRMREERSLSSLAHMELGDKFHELAEDEKQQMLDEIMAVIRSLASFPTI